MGTARPVVGVLLAAGSAKRFGGAKLMVPLPDGTPIGIAALKNLRGGVDAVVAVVRPGDQELASALAAHGARVTACPRAAEGMGVSLSWGVRAAPIAAGWVIALADMPWIAPATTARVADALRRGSQLAAPVHGGDRGHPVGIGARFYGELAQLSGDEGARSLLAAHASSMELIPVDDLGVLRDIDTPGDLDE